MSTRKRKAQKNPAKSMGRLVDTRAALLAALRRGPGYGLELMKRVGGLTLGIVWLSHGAAYPLLAQLEIDGLVTSEPRSEGRGGRPRRYFTLTKAGHALAEQQRCVVAYLFGLSPSQLKNP